jgi:hypothetical protein
MKRFDAGPLALRRRLLVATATLQRVRLARDWQALRAAVRPGPGLPAIALAGLAALALRARASAKHSAQPRPWIDSPLWGSAALTLWRVARAWLRRRVTDAPTPH